MKYSSVVQVAASVSVAAAAASTTCPPASVYVFEPQQQQKTVSGTPQLTNKQSQFILSDFLGTSSLYSSSDIKEEFPADFVHSYIASLTNTMNGDSKSSSDLATAIVIVNGLPDSHALFQESAPEFEIKESPSPSFFRAFVDRMSSDMAKVMGGSAAKSLQQSADKAISVVTGFTHKIEEAALKGLKDMGIYKRHPMMGDAWGHMMDSMMGQQKDEDCSSVAGQRLADDVARLDALAAKGLASGEKALLRLESLDVMLQNNKYADSYQAAVAKISKAINHLAEHVDEANLRLMVVAAPRDACTNKQETLLKPCDKAPGGLSKRSLKSKRSVVASAFPSIEACEAATGNCTGHGACIKKGTALDGETPLYGCACQASYNADKKQTTRYGGAACQKIDISVPTQMFLWSGIALVFAGAAAIKLVYSIDAEPLPGILNLGKKPTASN